ncbi:hypothetical protein D3C76_1531810 [compost metagenome]
MRTVVDALAPLFVEQAPAGQRRHQLHHVRRAVDDGRIDDTALTALPCLEDTGKHTDSQIQRAATDITDQGDGRRRRFACGTAVV